MLHVPVLVKSPISDYSLATVKIIIITAGLISVVGKDWQA